MTDYEEFLDRIPGYFQNDSLVNAVSFKITNNGTSQMDHKKMEERGDALVQIWSEETTIEDWTHENGQK